MAEGMGDLEPGARYCARASGETVPGLQDPGSGELRRNGARTEGGWTTGSGGRGSPNFHGCSECPLTRRFSGGPRSGPSAATGCWVASALSMECSGYCWSSGLRQRGAPRASLPEWRPCSC